MTAGHQAPESVYLACQRGLRRYDRLKTTSPEHTGGTAAAVIFAENMADQLPIDAGYAAEILEAHRLLDLAPRHPDGESEQQLVARLLWGGDPAPEWAQTVIDVERRRHVSPPAAEITEEKRQDPPAAPQAIEGNNDLRAELATLREAIQPLIEPSTKAPEYIAAAPSAEDRVLERLSDDLFTIDSETIAALRAAFWIAYRTALRAATGTARARSFRIPKVDQIAAGLGNNELNDARDAMAAAGPYSGYQAMPDNVAAVIDMNLDTAVSAVMEDFEAEAAEILTTAAASAGSVIARTLDTTATAVAEAAPGATSITAAATQLRESLLEWVRARLEGDRLPEDLGELRPPEGVFADAVGAAGGTAASDENDSIGAPILETILAAVASGTLAVGALQGIRAVAGRIPRLRRTFTWRRGNPPEPFPDHENLDGATWTTDEERLRAVGSARPRVPHAACRCRIKRGWVFT